MLKHNLLKNVFSSENVQSACYSQASGSWQEVASQCNSFQVTVVFAPQTCCQFVLFEVCVLQYQLSFASQMPFTARNSQIGGHLDLQRKGMTQCGYVPS